MVRRKQQVESVQKRRPDLEDGEGKKTRKPTRFHPGTVALRDIRKAQKNTNKSFRKASFRRVVREVLHNIDDKRFADFDTPGSMRSQLISGRASVSLCHIATYLAPQAAGAG